MDARHGFPTNPRTDSARRMVWSCPNCGVRARISLSARHSIGPGPLARVVRAIALPLGVMTAYALLCGLRGGGGKAVLAGTSAIIVVVALERVAGALPRTWRLRCRSCGWNEELEYR